MTQLNIADGRLVFDGPVTIRNADTTCAVLRDAITQCPDIRIDCTGVREVDLSFLQLLIAARLSARQASRRLTLSSPPDGAFLGALTRAGFAVTHESPLGAATDFWFEGATA